MTPSLSDQFLAAALKLADERPDRPSPSPSSVMRCTRQNWLKMRGYPKTHQPDNGESYISAETGRVSEPVLTQILLAMDPPLVVGILFETEEERELSADELAKVLMAGGQVDNVGVTAEGEHVLIEYKRKGTFGYLDLLRKGLREGAEDDYMQMQALMAAKGLKRGLYIAANFDRSALTANTRKWDERPNGVHIEWVDFSPAAAKAAKQRAEMQQGYIDNEDDPAKVPRDYEPTGENARWPCGWCPFFKECPKYG
ncbi:hypothetical protein LCGC14_1125740 [marine sediment metagenome]|uniref:PD-(D/E)XK endonuclease-like domain-containing protein n=1 Tax=marine sediment metagenome TaxID=412755 RepID=A0A0F9PKP6_9ZZZZ